MLGDVQFFLRWEGSFFKSALNIYDAKTNSYKGTINSKGFVINEKQYTVTKQTKSIFNRKLPFDVIVETGENYQNMLLRMNIEKVNKKWYTPYYIDELNGSVEFKNDIGYELILATFFCLHNNIQRLNSS